MKQMIFLIVILMSVGLFAQNTDKNTKQKSVQEMTAESFEDTRDALRGSVVPGYTLYTATIDSNTSVSDSIDLADNRIIGFYTDSAWTSASITFQTYNTRLLEWVDLRLDDNTELSYVATIDCFIIGKVTHFGGIRYLKIRSGTTGTPVNQGDDRVINILTRRY